jgi:hypothetical protein
MERADHFKKHRKRLGIPGGFVFEIVYERIADQFLGSPLNSDSEEFTRIHGATRNGDVVRYDKRRDVFGIKDRAVRIKTYYRPDPAKHLQGNNYSYYVFERGRA